MEAFPLTTIPMLAREGENYSTWSLCLLRILGAADPKIRALVDGSYAEPVPVQGKDPQVHFDEYRQWQSVSEEAKRILRTGLSDATRIMAGATPGYENVTARQLWLTLESLYAQVTFSNKMAMHASFDALRQGDASLDDFFAEVARRTNRLAALAWPVEPHRILNVLSYGLHPSFAHWLPAFQTAVQELTGDSFADAAVIHRTLTRIRQAETQLLQHTSKPLISAPLGLPAIPHAAAAAAAAATGLAVICVYCKKGGHSRETCHLRLAKMNAQKANQKVKSDKAKANKKKGSKSAQPKSAAKPVPQVLVPQVIIPQPSPAPGPSKS